MELLVNKILSSRRRKLKEIAGGNFEVAANFRDREKMLLKELRTLENRPMRFVVLKYIMLADFMNWIVDFWVKPITLISKNFRLRFKWDRKELGIGAIILKPMSPRSKYRVGFAMRFLWFCAELKAWEKKPVLTEKEIHLRTRQKAYSPLLWYKTLIVFHKNKSIDVAWSWNSFGTMIYYKSPDGTSSPVEVIGLKILWFVILLNFMHKPD